MRRVGWLWILIVLLPAVVAAQESDLTEAEQQHIAYVAGALERMAELDSVRSAAEQTIEMDVSTTEPDVHLTMTQVIDSATDYTGEYPATSATTQQIISTTINEQTTSLAMTIDVVVIDAGYYVQARDLSPEIAGLYPAGWVNTAEHPPGVSHLIMSSLDRSARQIIQMTGIAPQYMMTEETVIRIEELEPDTLNESAMRVFTVQFDPQGLRDTISFSGLAEALNMGISGIMLEDLARQLSENASVELTIWVGMDDDLVYRQEQAIVIDADVEGMLPGGEILSIQQEFRAIYDYFDFNEDVEIEVPEIDD